MLGNITRWRGQQAGGQSPGGCTACWPSPAGPGGGGIVCVRLGPVHVVAVSCRAPPWPARCCAATTPSSRTAPPRSPPPRSAASATAAPALPRPGTSGGRCGACSPPMSSRRPPSAASVPQGWPRPTTSSAHCAAAPSTCATSPGTSAATSSGGSLWGRRRHFAFASRRPQPAAAAAGGGPRRDETEHVDALNYLDAFRVSDYFPALVQLQHRQAGLPGAVARHAHHRDAAREAPAGAGVPLEQPARRGQDPAPGRPRRALCWPTRSSCRRRHGCRPGESV